MSMKTKLDRALSQLNIRVVSCKEYEFQVEYDACDLCQDDVLAGEDLCLNCEENGETAQTFN